jgi:hypothetical protein
MNKKETFEFLEQNFEQVQDLIANNVSYRKICEILKIKHLRYLYEFLNTDEKRSQTQACLAIASETCIDQALDQLESIEADDTNASVAKKRELSNHYKYLAQVKNQRVYNLNFKENQVDAINNNITPQLVLKIVNPEPKLIESNESS